MSNMKQRINLDIGDRAPIIILLRGYGFHLQEIADAIGCSNSQVSHDLKRIKAENISALELMKEKADEIRSQKIDEERASIDKQVVAAHRLLSDFDDLVGGE